MGVIPMKEDCGQEIYTRDHGTVKVDTKTWQDGRFHVVLSPNGAYQHINGLPIRSEEELVEAFGGYDGANAADLKKAINWFRNRHDQAGKAPRPIGMHPDGYPVFDDGTVPDFDDLYAYFRPGKGLTVMIVALQDYNDRIGTAGPPKELRAAQKPAAELEAPDPPVAAAPEKTAVAPDPLKYSPKARGEAKTKAKRAAARATKARAAKATQPATQAPPQG